MEKLKMHSPNFAEENIAKLAELFPNCVTEKEETAKDANEREKMVLKRTIDWDLLKQELSNDIVEGPQERYHLNWPGKRKALLTANAPIAKTLRPCREKSVDFDTTENLFIEGDNLDALKLLQETYLGKVKMIYIDPPYNTGKDFIYADNFAKSTEEYLLDSRQKDEEGNRLIANTDSNGRFHSDWLSMMYPRLKLARNLLKDDGVIFISIDENEIGNIEKVVTEIFGSENFLGSFPVVMNLKGNQDSFGFAETHEYVVIASKNKILCSFNHFPIDDEEFNKAWFSDEYGPYKEADNLRATGVNAPREKRPNLWYPIFLDESKLEYYATDDDKPKDSAHTKVLPISPNGEELSWYWSKNNLNQNKHNLILKKTSNGWQFYKKQRPQIGDLPSKKPKSFFYKPEYSTSTATTHLKVLLECKLFNGPKPVPFLKDLAIIGTNDKDIILDFFAGSATTTHAVMQLNAEDGGKRKFIMVQLAEACDEKSEAFKAGYKTIAEISKERIRRAGKQLTMKGENHSQLSTVNSPLDIGFRILKVDSSNMADVYYTPDAVEQKELPFSTDNIKDDRSSEDLLFQVLLDWGVDLTLPISREIIKVKKDEKDESKDSSFQKYEVFFVDGNALAACFEKSGRITENFCKELAGRQPLRVVFRDSGFKDDSAKINVEQIFKLMSPHTDVKTI